jgi:hypothetical protein
MSITEQQYYLVTYMQFLPESSIIRQLCETQVNQLEFQKNNYSYEVFGRKAKHYELFKPKAKKMFLIDHQMMSVKEIAEKFKIKLTTLRSRIQTGRDIFECINPNKWEYRKRKIKK